MSGTFEGNESAYGKKTIIYTTDSPLMCMAVNSKAEMIAVAGRNLFQVFSIHEDKFISLHRVKTPSRLVMSDITKSKTPATDSSGTECPPNPSHGTIVTATDPVPNRNSPVMQSAINQPRSHSVTDVSWSNVGDILATASTSGDVMLWDVGRGMTQNWPISSFFLLSYFPKDIRDPNPNSSCQIFFQRTASPSPVRDVSFCPKQGFMVAAAQENGVISIWDTRKGSRPFRAFQGHSCSITTLDWHPNWNITTCNWLATAGARDHLTKVWNLSSPSGLSSVSCPNVIYTVRTSNVNRVRWRPGFMTQLVTSCNLTIDLSVHIWDLQRPFIPYVSFEEHKDLVTCISWCPAEINNFYTVGRDGLLIRHSIKDGIRPVENAPPVALAFSPYGHLLHAVRKDRVEINKKSSTVMEESGKISYPIQTCIQHSNGNGHPSIHFGSSNSTSNSSNSTTATTIATTTNTSETVTSSKDFEHPTSSVTSSVNVDEVVTQGGTTTTGIISITSESTVSVPVNNGAYNIIHGAVNTSNINTTTISATSFVFTNSTGSECCTTVVTTSATTTVPYSSSSDLPQIGSLKSAKLFVSQAHSLLFHYKPCIETTSQPNWFDFTNALLPDLIILLAKNYKFIGSNVDMICEYNANVCLRFGQPFLVQFWLLLRSIYGSLGIDSHKCASQFAMQPQLSTPSHQHRQIFNLSDLDNQLGKHIQSSLINENKVVSPVNSSCFHIPTSRTTCLKCFRHSGVVKRKKRDIKINDTGTGIQLSSILESLGIKSRDSAEKSMEKTRANLNLDYRRHSSGNVGIRRQCVSKQLIDATQPIQKFLSYSNSEDNNNNGHHTDDLFPTIPSSTNSYNIKGCHSTLTNELLIHATKPIPLNINCDILHKPLTINDDCQLTSSISSSASPPIIQPSQSILKSLEQDISPDGLLFHNYHEDIDYLFHAASPEESLQYNSFVEDNSSKRGPAQPDIIEVIGLHDDPVIVETEYLPDEAFTTTTNIVYQRFEDYNQSQCKQKELYHTHHQKCQLMKQHTIDGNTHDDNWPSTSHKTITNDVCKIVSGSVDAPLPGTNNSSSKSQRKSVECTKILASKCCDLSLVEWRNRQILPASSFSGLCTATTTTTTKSISNESERTPFVPLCNSNHIDNHETEKCSEETLLKREGAENDCHFISQSVLSSSPSQSNTSSLTKTQHSLGTSKKPVQLLAPWHHSKSLAGFGYVIAVINIMFIHPITVESGHVQTVCTALLALGPERLRVSEWISESILEHWFISYLELLSRFRLWTVCARIIKQCGNPFAGADNQLYLQEFRRSINLNNVFRPIVIKPADPESKTSGNAGDTRPDVNTRTRWKSGGLANIDNSFAFRLSNMSSALSPGVAALNQASTTLSIRCGLCTKPLCASESTQQLTGHTGWACSRHATSFDPATITCALCHLVVRGLFVCCRGCSHGGHLEHMQAWLTKRSECPTGCGHRCRYD
ncbi:GATOR complex protein WDR24 [Schistosoma japonicum]|nr:GATOR complex protein WDR24 [Schistosoma japonicum]